MVSLVERMMGLQRKHEAARTEHDKILLQRQIDTTDQQIDQVAYDLYGVTQEEVQTVDDSLPERIRRR